jgi:hypothetical protein
MREELRLALRLLEEREIAVMQEEDCGSRSAEVAAGLEIQVEGLEQRRSRAAQVLKGAPERLGAEQVLRRSEALLLHAKLALSNVHTSGRTAQSRSRVMSRRAGMARLSLMTLLRKNAKRQLTEINNRKLCALRQTHR